MSKLERLIAIKKLSQKNSKWIHRDIFRILYKDDIWIAAYEKLKGNKGALTPGCTPEIMDGMSLDKLERIQTLVCAEAYTFKAVKLTYIPRPDEKKRPSGLSRASDKIVQEVMRIILEMIYEPVFHKSSFGFQTKLGCHDALDHMEKKFRWVDYVIEGDIEQAYPAINHHTLVKILEKRIADPRFIRLIWKLLGCGILDEEQISWKKTGVPQGSIVSPILSNIYYHELDEWVQGLKNSLETPNSSRKSLKSQDYKSFEYKINKVFKEMSKFEPQSLERQKLAKELKKLRTKRFKTDRLKNKVTRIEYVRYADDWMIGVSGNRQLASDIKEQVTNFMKDNLSQRLHPTKTKITDLRKGNAQFLGYEIFLPRNRSISRYKGKGVQTLRRTQPQLRFDIPTTRVVKRYIERGYLKIKKNKVHPISKAPYTVLEDHVIVSHYRSLWLGLLNYYSGCTNRGRLQYIHYLLHISCAMTLAHRHRISVVKIFKKHGKTLTTKVPYTKKTISFPYKTTWKLSERKWLHNKQIINPLVKNR